MKKLLISTMAILSIDISADTITLYSDPSTGQIFMNEAEGRVEIGVFNRIKETEIKENIDKTTPKSINITSKLPKVEFSGTHYFGYTSAKPSINSKYGGTSSGFELRRNYLQAKGYFNEKDYWRLTLDATKELASDAGNDSKTKGYANVFVKYAYLYLDEILPYTSVEFGIAHRPWIDYEEHNSWFYRSFNKVAIEEKATPTESGVDLVNSADLGVNFKTKTENFSSEIAVFNGEGYHSDKGGANQKNDQKLSLEWRLTAHLIGSGIDKMKQKEDTYAHISTFGLISKNHKDDSSAINQTSSVPLKGEYDRQFYGIHTIYNQPEFLIAAQYVKAQDKARDSSIYSNWLKRDYELLSINAEYRMLKNWSLVGRYDKYDWDDKTVGNMMMDTSIEGEKYIAALVYQYSKDISFIGSVKFIDEKFTSLKNTTQKTIDSGESKDLYMFTTEVKW